MFRQSFLFFVLLIGLWIVPSVSAAPVNDNYSNAILVAGASGSVMTSNVGATKEAGEPNIGLDRGGASIWYTWIAPSNGVLKVDTGGTVINTLVGVYVGSSLSNATLLAGSDYCDCVYVGVQANLAYHISLDGIYTGGGPLSSSIQFNYTFLNAVPNDNFANAIQLFDGAPTQNVQVGTTNSGATKEAGEPNHANNSGGRSVWFKWQSSFVPPKTMFFSLRSQKTNLPGSAANSLLAVYTGSSVNSLTPVQGFASGGGIVVFKAQPSTTYYIAIDGYDIGQGPEVGNYTLTWGLNKSSEIPDFDQDGIADLTVFRPSTGVWYALRSVDQSFQAVQWGTNGDKPLITETNNNNKSDVTVFRPDTGMWYLNRDYANPFIYAWGVQTDIPLATTIYAAGSKADHATVFRPSTGEWWIDGVNGSPFVFGLSGDIPITADFDGDGTDDLCAFRPSNGTWYIWSFRTNQYRTVHFGLNGDKPVVADYDADGQADIAVYRPSTGTWYALRSIDSSVQVTQFGFASDIPQAADYDGDGKADPAIYRNGAWWVKHSFFSAATVDNFGLATDIPVVSRITN